MITGNVEEVVKEKEKKEEKKRRHGESALVPVPDEEKKEVIGIVEESLNRGLSTLNPDLLYSNLVNNFSLAEKTYGKKLLRLLTGDDVNTIEMNIKLEEYKKELREKIGKKIKELKEAQLIDDNYFFTEEAINIYASNLLKEELEKLKHLSLEGEISKIKGYGSKVDVVVEEKKSYRQIDNKKTLKIVAKRKHKSIEIEDLRFSERKQHEGIELVLVLDTSSSMKGSKISEAKKAALLLCHLAISEKSKVGLVAFSTTTSKVVRPTKDTREVIFNLISLTPRGQTNIYRAIMDAINLFSGKKISKHIILISDILPNVGEKPLEKLMEAVDVAARSGITISVVGIQLDDEGKTIGEKIALIGKGRLYLIDKPQQLDLVLLKDYLSYR